VAKIFFPALSEKTGGDFISFHKTTKIPVHALISILSLQSSILLRKAS
jgi:hypothetical protein